MDIKIIFFYWYWLFVFTTHLHWKVVVNLTKDFPCSHSLRLVNISCKACFSPLVLPIIDSSIPSKILLLSPSPLTSYTRPKVSQIFWQVCFWLQSEEQTMDFIGILSSKWALGRWRCGASWCCLFHIGFSRLQTSMWPLWAATSNGVKPRSPASCLAPCSITTIIMSSAAAYTIFSVHSASLTILWDVVQTTLVENFNRIYPSTITETLKRDI